MVQQMQEALKTTLRSDPELFIHVMEATNIERSPIDFAVQDIVRLNWTMTEKNSDGSICLALDRGGVRVLLTLERQPDGKFRIRSVDQVH